MTMEQQVRIYFFSNFVVAISVGFFDTNFNSQTNFKYSQSDLSNDSLHHVSLFFAILC